ncbi:MAG: RagB/SusD family nutrient uptake outer membrane protein [Bacteroidales bacterium]|nr:RagB/SusD family nutrient uptake outer membrane protein [Bacteroidales bacterium]
MNIMKLKYILPSAVLAVMGMSSCVNDLDVTPIDPSTVMTVDAGALFNKCYANMAVAGNGGANGDCDVDGLDGGTTGFLRQMWNANELTTEEAICCWGDEGIPAFNFNQWTASHPMLKGFYNRLYLGVTLCNFYLSEVGEYDATMSAEVRFLRALYYYHIMDCFGNAPFLTEMSAENAQQASRSELFAFVESELLEAVEAMAEPRTNTYGRADKVAAWNLLARLYLNAEVYTGTAQWAKAAEYAKKVMDSNYEIFTNAGAYAGKQGWSAYQMLFMGDNSTNGAQNEAILPLLQDGINTTSWGTSLFLMASTFKADMTLVGDATNNTKEAWGGNRARPELVAKFFPNGDAPQVGLWAMLEKAGDDRALFWGKDRKLDVETTSEFTEGYSVCKFTNFFSNDGAPSDPQFPDADFFLMRKAEANLTYAEAQARLNGGVAPADAIEALNALRTRAHADTKISFTLDEICDEWCREFYYEGRRRSDLIRFDKFGGNNSYKWQWKGGVMAGANFDKHLNVFAIPDADMNANSNLVQNPGY